MNSNHAIKTEKISKNYGSLKAVDAIDLEVRSGLCLAAVLAAAYAFNKMQ